MNEENQILQDPPVKTAKVAEYFINLYDKSGYVLEENKAFELASSLNIKNEIARQHRILSIPVPPQTDIDSIFTSFVNIPETEKKNLLQNTITELESSSVLEDVDSSSDSDQKAFQVSLDEDPVGPEKLFIDSMNRVNMNLFSMNGDDAAIELDKQLGMYGFKFESSALGRKVSVTANDGEVREFRLFTESYKNLPGQTENINKLAEIRLQEMKDFFRSKANSSVFDNFSAILINSDETNIIDNLAGIVSKYDDEVQYEISDALSRYKDNFNVNDYIKNGILNRAKIAKDLNEARANVISKSDKFNVTDYESLEKAADRFNINKSNIASVLGGVLSKTGAYSKIDINDEYQINKLSEIGLSPADIPVDAIRVNGKARSLNYLTSNILYDFDRVQAVRDGKITVEIGDPKTAGLLAPFVQRAKKTAETQKAFASQHAGKSVLRFFEETGELGTNTLQAIGISLVETTSNLGYIFYDSLIAAGVDESTADSMVYGSLGLSGFGGLRPHEIEFMRNEYLPKWDGSYLDANGFHELITRGSQDFSNSLITTSLFMIPGGQPIALANVGIGSYAQDRIAFEKLRKDIEDKRSRGYALTEEEMNVINTSDSQARLISLGKAATEVAVTRAFTGKFFKNYQKFGGVKQKIVTKHGSIADFNKTYAKAVRNDIIGKVSRVTGISGRAIATEIPEEEIIAFTNYTSDVVFGYKKFDHQEARELFLNTGISSIFTSMAMGKVASLGTSRRARKMAVDIVASNLSLPQERQLATEKITTDMEIAVSEDKLIADGIDPSTDIGLMLLKKTSLDLSNRINDIQAEKIKIAKQMPAAEKLEFLEIMEAIEKTKKSADGATDRGRQKAILDEIQSLKEKGRKILSKYPSELSYYFADQATQDKFESKAIDELSAEAVSKGQSFDFRSGDDAVLERASQLYSDYLKSEKEDELEGYYAFNSFGAVNLPVPTVSDDGKFEGDYESYEGATYNLDDVDELMLLLENEVVPFTLNRFTFDKSSDRTQDLINELREINKSSDKTDAEFDSKIQELTDIINNPLSSGQDIDKAEKDRAELIDSFFELDGAYFRSFEEARGDSAVKRVQDALESEGGLSEDKKRLANIFSRLRSLDIETAYLQLSEKDISTIKQFNKDLSEGKRPQIGRMESMIEAMEVVNQIYAKSGGKIKLTGIVDENGTLTEKGVGLVNDMMQNIYVKGIWGSGGFATKDVLARTLFRDREVGAPFMNVMNEAFRASAEGENTASKTKRDHLNQYKKDGGKDPNSIDNSYEMFILAALKRESATIDPSGKNEEFSRMQNLILDELKIRRRLAESNPDNKVYKLQYDAFNNAVKKLGVVDAGQYSDVSSKASKANVNAVERLASVMPGKRAFDRINNFESYSAFEYTEGTYTPLFMSKEGQAYNDYFGRSDSDVESMAGSLKDVTRPGALKGDLRLNPEMFFDNAYKAYRGMEMDIQAKQQFETLDYIVNSSRFQSMFEGETKNAIIESFKGIKKNFEADVRRSESSVLDMQTLNKPASRKKLGQTFSKIANIAYGTIGNVSLSRWSQRASQYYSAVAGSSVYLKNSRAKKYLGKKSAAFTFGTAKFFDGNRRKTTIEEGMSFLSKHRDAKLGNIYMKSRTGLRNSLTSNLAIDSNQKIPISYYVSAFKLDPSKESVIAKAIGSSASVDAFLDYAAKANEFTLDLWLGSADRLAANATFEAAYLDYKISNGDKIGGDLDSWWSEQNKTPDLEAIRYADEIVAKTMRQTDQASEAEVYATKSAYTKNMMRLAFPFSKFMMNAKSDIANNLNILLDPNVSQSQKQISEKVIAGRAAEIAAYNFIKLAAGRMTINGMISLLGFGAEEEDIEKYGGMTGFISEEVLPIVSKEDFDPIKLNISEATTFEEYEAILKAQAGFTEIDDVSKEFKSYSKTFDDKFQTQGDYSVLGPAIQDLLMTMVSVPIPDIADDIAAYGFNQVWGEDVATEFISQDLSKTDTGLGKLDFLSEKSGIFSIGFEQYNAYQKAKRMAFDFEIRKSGGDIMPTVIEHLSAPTDVMREKLIGATQILYYTRLFSLTVPGAPRADLDKFADKLERAIERNFSTGKMDDKMHELRGTGLFPLEQKLPFNIDINRTVPE